jgi:hypothetical protein
MSAIQWIAVGVVGVMGVCAAFDRQTGHGDYRGKPWKLNGWTIVGGLFAFVVVAVGAMAFFTGFWF